MVDRFVQALWFILVESGLWLLLGFFLAGVIHAFVPPSFLQRHIGRAGVASVAKAALLGIPLPLCSCSVIPVAAGLRRGGAGAGAAAAFTISTPQTGEESIPLTWALFGPVFALARPVVAVITAFTAGLLIDRFAARSEPRAPGLPDPPATGACCAHTPEPPPGGACCADGAPHVPPVAPSRTPGIGDRARSALRYAFVTLPVDLAPWLVLGLTGAALVGALVPPGWIAGVASSPWVQMVAMLFIGVPLYICATSSTPLAFALVAAGLSPGAALVLLLAGPATNVATMAWVLKDLGGRALAIYLAVIAVTALLAGALFNALLGGLVRGSGEAFAHAHGAGAASLVGAVALVALLASAVWMRYIAPAFKRRATSGCCALGPD